ncbi:GGDEF domain-containing protein [Halomonas sp. YLGW01]|uniref:GGDEF domain-containing protein n=1 Tax=Halomonas sp. YLGW01 TaxID=2773308 RepID=UPI001F5BC805|nr:GGDEF domain-containing protein [Halomonas sp. YLGW01]
MATLISRDEPFSLVVDVDHFKHVNDTLGHDGGDATLLWLSARILVCLHDGDIVARTGGEEFVIVMHRASASKAEQVIEGLRQHINTGIVTLQDGSELSTTISSGLSEHAKGRAQAG